MYNLNSGFLDALKLHKQSQQELHEDLETLPIKNEKFSKEELNEVLGINNKLKQYKDDNSQSQEKLNEVMNYLDSIDIWKSKFTTGSDTNKISDDDSIYYITPNNISLRIKRANLSQGLKHVIQPLMENIVFVGGKFYPSEKPIIGSITSEYSSQEFDQLQNENEVSSDFISRIKKYYKDGQLYFIGKPDNLYHEHGGNIVNCIYFEK